LTIKACRATISNIKKELGEKKFIIFEKWIYGQTVGTYKVESLVYLVDWLRFDKGLPALD